MKTSLWERLQTMWHTLIDKEQADLLLSGPLPLWMQEAYERAARETGTSVGHVIFEALRHSAEALQHDQRERDSEEG